MEAVTIDRVMNWRPCYEREQIEVLFAERETITALDVLAMPIPSEDVLWAVLREDLIDLRTLRLFAVWCARQVLALVAQPDLRSVVACDISERYADGKATEDELIAAEAAAEAAADAIGTERVAAWSAAGAAWITARATWDTAWTAAQAARDATWSTAPGRVRTAADDARDAARAASWNVVRAMAWATADVPWPVSWNAARDAQIAQLRLMLTNESA
jgi:hypothetical protein